MEEVKKFLENYVRDIMKEKCINVDTEVSAVGDYLDSLDIVDVVCAAENQFEIEIGDEFFFNVSDRTITEIAEYIDEKIKEK